MSVTPARKGEVVNLPAAFASPETGDDAVVSAPCGGESGGAWVCSSHRMSFPNNRTATIHDRQRGRHLVYFYCNSHGPEAVPA